MRHVLALPLVVGVADGDAGAHGNEDPDDHDGGKMVVFVEDRRGYLN